MKKKITSVVLSIVLVLSMLSGNAVFASNDIIVTLNGDTLAFDVPPQIIDGRTMVPMRKIFESLGAAVTWDKASQTATGKKGDTVVNISINSKTLFKNGVPKTLDVPPVLIDARTLVPVRAIAESFDCEVLWHQDTRIVEITTNNDISSDKTSLTASEISEKVSPSVFYIEVYDTQDEILGSGSGFFISSDGIAVTNYHVIENSASAYIMTINGQIYNVSGIIAYDKNLDVAIIKVDTTSTTNNTISGFPTVTLADSDDIKAGQSVFALGSPVGLQNTISNGIISNVKQVVGDDTFIQITAPISHGSSGGALVNEYGEILGITSAGIDDAQNIGFAIPINVINLFDLNTDVMSYDDFYYNDKSFTLDVYPTSIEIEVGESAEVLVYADGKGDDWSIYWQSNEEYLIDCEWGDWLEDYSSVCPIIITGEDVGVATVTIYSDVDFRGIDITVYVKEPSIQIYPSSSVTVPTYTSVTGVPLLDIGETENYVFYEYNFTDIDDVIKYEKFLINNGFTYYDKEDTAYHYVTPQNRLISVIIEYTWNQVWIQIPR